MIIILHNTHRKLTPSLPVIGFCLSNPCWFHYQRAPSFQGTWIQTGVSKRVNWLLYQMLGINEKKPQQKKKATIYCITNWQEKIKHNLYYHHNSLVQGCKWDYLHLPATGIGSNEIQDPAQKTTCKHVNSEKNPTEKETRLEKTVTTLIIFWVKGVLPEILINCVATVFSKRVFFSVGFFSAQILMSPCGCTANENQSQLTSAWGSARNTPVVHCALSFRIIFPH